MGIEMPIVILVSLLICLTSPVFAAQGKAVFYNPPYTPSKCFGNRNNGVMVAGVSDALWNNGAACGRRYRVRCIGGTNGAPHPCRPGRSVVVTVVDYCRSQCDGILNLSKHAFSVIADPDAGNVRVQFNPV